MEGDKIYLFSIILSRVKSGQVIVPVLGQCLYCSFLLVVEDKHSFLVFVT